MIYIIGVYISFSIFVGYVVGRVEGFVPGLITMIAWPIGLGISIYEKIEIPITRGGVMENDTPNNLPEAMEKEIQRNRELLEVYKTIPTGAFGSMMIDRDIKEGIAALASGDVIRILRSYEALKGNE